MSQCPVSVIAAIDKRYEYRHIQQLITDSDITLLAAAKCTEELSALCHHMTPDFIIFDISITTSPISAIQDLKSLTNQQSVVIATTTNHQIEAPSARSVIDAGASCFLEDIFNGQTLAESIHAPARKAPPPKINISSNDLRQRITNIMYMLNIGPQSPGFHLLRELIVDMIISEELIPELTKEKIHCIAKKFNLSYVVTEKAISKTINDINQQNSRQQILQAVMNKELSVDSSFVNAKEFTSLVADKLRLDLQFYAIL